MWVLVDNPDNPLVPKPYQMPIEEVGREGDKHETNMLKIHKGF